MKPGLRTIYGWQHIKRLQKAGRFPLSVPFGSNTEVFIEEEIDRWAPDAPRADAEQLGDAALCDAERAERLAEFGRTHGRAQFPSRTLLKIAAPLR